MKKSRFYLVALSGLVYIGSLAAQAPSPEDSAAYQHQRTLFDALRSPDGLHKAALLNNGRYVVEGTTVPRDRSDTLKELIAESDVIVIGTVETTATKLANEGRRLETFTTLQIRSVLAGAPPQQITLVEPGGTYHYPDGSEVVEIQAGLRRLIKGHRYLMFLKRQGDGVDRYIPSSWEQGTFELDSKHRAYAHSLDTKHELSKAARAGEYKLVETIRHLVATSR